MSSQTDIQPGVLTTAGLRRVVTVLSLTEITSWGVLYYSFPILAPSVARDMGWTMAEVTAAFSASRIIAAVLGVGVGRIIDSRGPRLIMTLGSASALPALLAIALAPNYVIFFGGWVVAGVAMAGVLYAPAFAALTHWAGSDRVRALTTVTLVAGLASTVFAPLTALIHSWLDWRQTYLILLLVLAGITLPGHWFGLRSRWVPHPHLAGEVGATAHIRLVWGSRAFVLLTLSLSAVAFTSYAVLINLVPLLTERGLTTGEAAIALGLGGVGQVAGRLGYATFAARTTPRLRAVIISAAVAASTFALAVLPGPLLALAVICVLAGVGRGVFTLIQATAISDRWGTTAFGQLNGLMSAPIMFAGAVAPFAGAALVEALGDHSSAFAVLAALAGLAAITAFGTHVETFSERRRS